MGPLQPAGSAFYSRNLGMLDVSAAYLLQVASPLQCSRFSSGDTGAHFYGASQFGDLVEIESSVTRFGRSSFAIEHKVTRGGGMLLIEAHEKRNWAPHSDDGALKGHPPP